MLCVDTGFVCDRFDSSNGKKDYSRLPNIFSDLDRMKVGDFFLTVFILGQFFLFHMWAALQIPSVGTVELQGA